MLWVVGKNKSNDGRWEFQGIFDTENKAIDACKTPNDFIGPCYLNEEIPQESTYWPGAYYPKQ